MRRPLIQALTFAALAACVVVLPGRQGLGAQTPASPFPTPNSGSTAAAPAPPAPGGTAANYPAEMVIMMAEVEVRSGPTKEYYPTSKLRYGDRVLVLRESKDQPGWLAIRPPQGSFSWINAKHVKVAKHDERTGVVEGDGNALIPVRPGSSLINKAPDVESVKIPAGSIVTILDKAVSADGQTWLPILPPPTEVRFIPGEAVQARQPLAGNNASFNGPAAAGFTGNTLIAQADQALQSGNVEKAKQLYKEAAEKSVDYQHKIYCYNRLVSLSQSPWSPTQAPGHPQTAQGNPNWQPFGQTASLTSKDTAGQVITYPPSWSQWGVLRKAPFEKDGQPVYILQNQRGQTLLHAVSAPGTTLRDYVGRTVALYGPLTYRSNEFVTHLVVATHVATP